MRMPTTVTAAVSLTAVLALGAPLSAHAPATARDAPPPPKTVVSVTGDAENGFEIEYYDGTGKYPPTASEARAECAEYDTRIERVRCRTEVATWYRDLAVLQQALVWANAS